MNRGTSIRGWLNSSGSIDQPASLPLCFAPIKSVTLFAGPSGGLAFASTPSTGPASVAGSTNVPDTLQPVIAIHTPRFDREIEPKASADSFGLP
ncbi:unnamed protein product [Heterotrigona itama]|uniref:Uncharacterized protein n=1 Tax=Heterotrigona itama TaxID=395501 RepID=A0A6V7HB29_9HYME|nr:unnamed protein product [Heterotrigona itama]